MNLKSQWKMLEIKISQKYKELCVKAAERQSKYQKELAAKKKASQPKQQKPLKKTAKGKRKRKVRMVQFKDTAVGHYMLVYTPIEYHMLMEYIDNYKKASKNRKLPIITTAQIELLALNTDNKAFRTTSFRKAIMAYKKYGMYPPKKAEWTVREALHYARYSYMIYKEIKECERILS